jgi:hypothetical protein
VNNGIAVVEVSGLSDSKALIGSTLSAVIAEADLDGMGEWSVRWESRAPGSGGWSTAGVGESYGVSGVDEGMEIRAVVSYVDKEGFAEEAASAEAAVPFVDAGTGSYAIEGAAVPGTVLQLKRLTNDPDGNGPMPPVVSWEVSADGAVWTALGVDGETLATDGSFQGQQVRAVVTDVDGEGFATTVTTEALQLAYVNEGAASFVINGTVSVGEELRVEQGNGDPDGDGALSYGWERSADGVNWSEISGAEGVSYGVVDGDQGQQLRSRVRYVDGEGFAEDVATAEVLIPLVNNGIAVVEVSGLSDSKALIGSTLSAVIAEADPDGMGEWSVRWESRAPGSGGWSTAGVGESYGVSGVDEGMEIRAVVSYVDQEGFAEKAASAEAAVPFVDAGTGSYAIEGTLRAGETLVAKREVNDPDGNGTETFTWQTSILGNWVAIGSGSTLAIAVSLAGRPVRLQVLTVDAEGHSATVFSDVVQVEPLDAALPVITGVTVAGNQLRLQFSEAVVTSGLIPSLFSATVAGAVRAVNAVSAVPGDPTRLTLTLAGAAPTGSQAVMLRYSDPSGNNLSGVVQDLAGNDLASTTGAGLGAESFSSSANVTNLAASYANLVLTGTAVTATGNGAANRITVDQATAVANVINGGAGVDVMDGGNGSDIYLVADSSHHSEAEIVDSGATGSDELRFSSTIAGQTLVVHGGNIGLERVTIGTGTAIAASTAATTALNVRADSAANALAITGNNGVNRLIGSNYADTIIGNGGNDTIEGGDGADTLTGGLGADVFRFASGIGGSGIDRITDFTVSQNDVIHLDKIVFTALPTSGVLAAAAFTPGSAAKTAAHRIGYNAASGALWYDADGNGAGMSITFAQLNTGVVGMTAARFVVT